MSFLMGCDAYLMTRMLSNWRKWFCHALKMLWESGSRQPFCIHYQGSARLATLLKIIYALISLQHSYSCCLLQTLEFHFSVIPFLLFEMNTIFKGCTLFSSCMLVWLGSCNFFRVFTLCSSFMFMRLVSCNNCILGHFLYSESFTVCCFKPWFMQAKFIVITLLLKFGYPAKFS